MPNSSKKKHEKRRRKFFIFLISIVVIFTLLHVSTVDAKAPDIFKALEEKLGIVKVTSKVGTKLPDDVQKAITEEAIQELREGHSETHSDVLAEVDLEDIKIADSGVLPDSAFYVFKRFSRRTAEFFTFDPLAKTQLILKHNSSETVETLALVQKSLKEKNPSRKRSQIGIAANELGGIENRFNQVWNIVEKTGKQSLPSDDGKNKARAISGAAFTYAEKFFRQELILQELEDKIDDSEFVKIENGRSRRLGILAKILTTYHPDPQVLSRELANSLSPETGTYYKELKTAQILQEIEDATGDENQKTFLRLAQYILIERFEYKVLRLPSNKRGELLGAFVNRIYGNPMREFKTFSRIRKVFKNRELILFSELYKTKILEDFEKRTLELTTSDLQNQFIGSWVKDPADLRILEALELRLSAQKNPDPKLIGIVKNLKKGAFDKIAELYKDNPEKLKDTLFYESATTYPDALDVKVVIDVKNSLGDSKASLDLEQKVVDTFVSNLPRSVGGTTATQSSEVNSIIAELRSEIPSVSLNEVAAAVEAEIAIDSLTIPQSQESIVELISELEQNQNIEIITENLHIPINEVVSQTDTSIIEPSVGLVEERVEQLTEEIFSAPAGTQTPVEETLPPAIQQEIEHIQQTTGTPQINPGLVETVVNAVEQTAPTTPPPPTSSPTSTETPPSSPEVSVPAL